MNLFNFAEFVLSSGKKSKVKIDCDALSDKDINTLAEMIRVLVGQPFGSVEGIPQGGLKLAEALREFATDGAHLIVDDVFTTGGSIQRQRQNRASGLPYGQLPLEDPNCQIIGAVIFTRGKLPESGWVKAIWHMDASLWEL